MYSKIKPLLKNPWLKYSLEILIILAVFYAISLYKKQDLVKGNAPSFNEVFLNGKPVKLADYQGNAVLIHFWATWCPVCRLEQDSIEAISKDHDIITIAMNSGEADKIQAFMTKNNLSFPVIIDDDGILSRRYGITGVPTSIIVNPEGIIEYSEIGYTTNWGLRLRLWLAGS
ncbi:Membrane protein, suppressor for copper-sensitivity ScsD [hydrothermal vent metagenome]|uniref:Membrane protein, suppressor for copper-sensitivity ScsD n=1 Tax=hydrothermal vent metagenome TaxID=652676 RepID=A0A3B1A444_9ZZZZ